MRLLTIIFLFLGINCYSQIFPVKVSESDSLLHMLSIKGRWRYVGHYYLRVYGDVYKRPNPIYIGDTTYIYRDTFINYWCDVEKVISNAWIYDKYEIDTANSPAFNFIFHSKYLPISVKKDCRNPNYTLASEFVVHRDTLYYDKYGIVYKFVKVKKH